MIELGQLESHHDEFDKRDTRVVVVSIESQEDAQKTHKDFPSLVVVADSKRNLISAAEVLHAGVGPRGADTAAPTTFLIDKQGKVRALFRPRMVTTRLSAKEVLAAVDADLVQAQ
jgi:alkyl hydroperoxide reductase subunit AhpC